MKNIENNKVTVSGVICSGFEFDHKLYGENFYMAYIETARESGTVDTIPFIVSERMIKIEDLTGVRAIINGQFRSYNKHMDNGNRLILSVFVRDIQEDELPFGDMNQIELEGYVCKQPVYRKTPLGREIADLLLAVNRPYGKTDYIPCICWGRNARYASTLKVGNCLSVCGRIQSRKYLKKISEEEFETRVAYEVSVSKLEVLNDEEQSN